jgi:hypothetical protein
MDEEIGRESIQDLLQLQIGLLQAYGDLLKDEQWGTAKNAIGTALKEAITALASVANSQSSAAGQILDAHKNMVEHSRQLLEKLLAEQKKRTDRYREARGGPAPTGSRS